MDWPGCCLLSVLHFFSHSSSVNSALFPFRGGGVGVGGSSPPSAWAINQPAMSPILLQGPHPLVTVIIQRWESGLLSELASVRLFLQVGTRTSGGSLFPTQDAKLEKYESG